MPPSSPANHSCPSQVDGVQQFCTPATSAIMKATSTNTPSLCIPRFGQLANACEGSAALAKRSASYSVVLYSACEQGCSQGLGCSVQHDVSFLLEAHRRLLLTAGTYTYLLAAVARKAGPSQRSLLRSSASRFAREGLFPLPAPPAPTRRIARF